MNNNQEINCCDNHDIEEEADFLDNTPDVDYYPFAADAFEPCVADLLSDMANDRHNATLFRDDIIKEICSILISENKPNALLVGPAGTGKTNIAEELAYRIKMKDSSIPQALLSFTIYSINLSDIISGSGLVGDLERKMKKLVEYLEDDNNKAILFIDEIHILFRGESYKKVAQMLKPALSRGKIKVIAATTTQEVKLIDEDPAFNRRFSRVLVNELSADETKTVLNRVIKSMETHYGRKIIFNDDIADLLVKTADEFCIAGSHRPDNAITLLDRAIAAKIVSMPSNTMDNAVITLDKDLVEATAFRLVSGNSSPRVFNESGFRQSLAIIRGQQDIIDDITKTLHLYDMHLRPHTRPLTFLFAGPSGVGKTEVAKIIAKEYFGEKPIILNMTEYNSSASINRIIGSPAGYVGSESNNELPFDILATNPYKVILLDEFEKCDRSVQRLFMSAFDEGFIQTNTGKTIDFSKSIIIATTNAGYIEHSRTIGFGNDNAPSSIESLVFSRYFDTELLNRFSHRYTFNTISKSIYEQIIHDCLTREIAQLDTDRFGTDVTVMLNNAVNDEIIKVLSDNSYDAALGARPIRTVVTEYIDGILLSAIKENRLSTHESIDRQQPLRQYVFAIERKETA